MPSEHGYTGPLADKWELLERRSLLAERALQACVAYSDPSQRTAVIVSKQLQQIAAELAALEAQP